MKVAIMQPTYLPWIGYFGMMDRVDLFVILDSVQFDRRSWQQRNQIKTPNGAKWITVPVLSKGKRDQLIKDVVIDTSRDFFENHIKLIESNYKKSAYYAEYSGELFSILQMGHERLVALNIELITWVKDTLGISSPLILSSDLSCDGVKADLLANICVRLGATEYFSAPGSKDYLDNSDSFKNQGIPISYHTYDHPVYPQCFGDFIPYLSTVDLLFNVGPKSLDIIRNGLY